MESILETVKKLLGLSKDYTAFDTDIVILINSVFSTLQQLGVGPINGFEINDYSEEWYDFIPEGDPRYNSVKTYIYLRVRKTFDPPASSFVLESINEQIKELEWRLRLTAEQE